MLESSYVAQSKSVEDGGLNGDQQTSNPLAPVAQLDRASGYEPDDSAPLSSFFNGAKSPSATFNHVSERESGDQNGDPPVLAVTFPLLPFKSGKRAIVDAKDLPRVGSLIWRAHRGWGQRWYAVSELDGRQVYLHRFILGLPDGVQVDHKNLDGLDCRRLNLRPATRSELPQDVRVEATA